MGCWNETCGITGLPILGGDEVVMVVFDNLEDHQVRMSWLEMGMLKHYGIYLGEYNDYGWIEGLEEEKEMGDRPDLSSVFFHKKAWDWLTNAYDDSRYWRYGFDRRESDMREMFSRGFLRISFGRLCKPIDDKWKELLIGSEIKDDDPNAKQSMERLVDELMRHVPELTMQYFKIVRMAMASRINLFAGLPFKGHQSSEWKLRTDMRVVIRSIVDQIQEEDR